MADKTEKVLANLRDKIKQGDYYQALQMFRAIAFRNASAGRHGEAQHLLFEGAKELAQFGHYQSSCDLAEMAVQSLVDNKVPETPALIDTITAIEGKFPAIAPKEQLVFLQLAIRWTADNGPCEIGNSRLHDQYARRCRTLQMFAAASVHFTQGDSVLEYASMLNERAAVVSPSERDLLLARAVLQYLAIGNLRDANAIFRTCSATSLYPAQSPLLHFVGFLLPTCERDAAPLFKLLRAKYAQSLQRDPGLAKFVNETGKVFFNLSPTGASGPGGLLQNLFQNLGSAQ